MRIVGGEFSGRKFIPPAKNWPTRPTTDFAKEALFNILANKISFEDCNALDLFGGTGSISYECISRGCKHVTYVERFYACIKFVQSISEKLDIEKRISIVKQDVFKYLKTTDQKFDFVFADPPYDLKRLAEIPDLICKSEILNEEGFFIIEHDRRHDFKSHLAFAECRTYGNVNFSFFQP